jgi:hypothetical protein
MAKNAHRGETLYSVQAENRQLYHFLISNDLEGFIKGSEIGLSYRSDHSPVSV